MKKQVADGVWLSSEIHIHSWP